MLGIFGLEAYSKNHPSDYGSLALTSRDAIGLRDEEVPLPT